MKFFDTFYGRLSLLFLGLLFILGLAQIYFTTSTWNHYYAATDQALNRDLAEAMASELQPFARDSLNMAEIEHSIHYMMVLNPKVEIYLLAPDGQILAFFAEPHKKVKNRYVNLKPVHEFLSADQQDLILGDDPRYPQEHKPFSAARMKVGSAGDGYLYIIIGSELYTKAAQSVRDNYLVQALIRGLLITLIGAAIIGLLLFFVATRRLRNMTSVVREFSTGRLQSRAQAVSRDEIGSLARSFNEMADTIVRNLDELKNTDRLRRELIANISHDLRSPLASIRGYLETIQIKGSNLTAGERNRYLKIIEDTTGSMVSLVEQLFELSKLDAQQVKPEFEPFALPDLINDVHMKFMPAAQKAGINLQATIPSRLPQVYADIRLIERVLSNLVDNGIRYTPAGGTVKISVLQEADKVRVLVSDTGFGMQSEDIPHIFERFYRAEKSRAKATGGTGLGLAISKKIMEIHQRTINVQSQLNVGSTFSFELAVWNKNAADVSAMLVNESGRIEMTSNRG